MDSRIHNFISDMRCFLFIGVEAIAASVQQSAGLVIAS
jgi:hypothetical protein